MRKALIVGIDYYSSIPSLYGCVNDANAVKSVLERHGDGSLNFGIKLLCSTGPNNGVGKRTLKAAIEELFLSKYEVALFYFSGHGYISATGGYLLTSDCESGDEGIPLFEILTRAHAAQSENKVIILDSCHSGIAGSRLSEPHQAELSEGMTILTASTAEQYATEENGRGVFTTLFTDALNGAGANLMGDITLGSVYAHIDQSLGPWEQRPGFKTNVSSFVPLRKVHPVISLDDLRRIKEFFPSPGYEFKLDPSYEPESSNPIKEHTEMFAILQKYNRVNLLVPVGATHMYHAAMSGKSCKLTVLGEHYRRLVVRERI
jgi:hypothetical protein